jgi:hypothetical protein
LDGVSCGAAAGAKTASTSDDISILKPEAALTWEANSDKLRLLRLKVIGRESIGDGIRAIGLGITIGGRVVGSTNAPSRALSAKSLAVDLLLSTCAFMGSSRVAEQPAKTATNAA